MKKQNSRNQNLALPNSLPQHKGAPKRQSKREPAHIRKASEKTGTENALHSLEAKRTSKASAPPSVSGRNPKRDERRQNVSAAALADPCECLKDQGVDKCAPESAYCESIDLAEEIEPIFESEEFDAEVIDTAHHTPPVFVTNRVQSMQASSPFSNSQNRLEERKEGMSGVVPMFKRNFSPRGENVEDLTGFEIELVNEDLNRKEEKNNSGSTTDNSSGCHSDGFVESASFAKKEQVGPQNFIAHKLLGKGSFGEVYLVQRIGTEHFYAMKVVKKAKIMSQNLIKYSLTERKVLSEVNHPFIVKLHFAFQATSRLFLVLKYCPGGDLSDYLRQEKKFTEQRAKMYVMEILLALEYLHKKDIIFRDLKPDNVVLDEDGHALLTDFGLSKEGVYDNQGAKSFCGSLAYLAPEMIKRTGHGKSVDWYLLGVLLYEMLVGVPPYYSSDKYFALKHRDQLLTNIQKGILKIPASMSEPVRSIVLGVIHTSLLATQPQPQQKTRRRPNRRRGNQTASVVCRSQLGRRV
eukprot:TRINITY_DN7481_c0_g1_i1.p1 TRINITY_DN7481_c0_g1~~TRINITY_DN7481_c0_g1_i1.p1  ORF type:complete len:522 (+),score=95.27 TRINITY_DN7481_c0_g1_i1:190-1755(+)